MPSPKQHLETLGIQPKKSLGQNYIHDENILSRIIESADLPPHATVLEIGPGLGALSVGLAPITDKLILVETDERIRPVLEAELDDFSHIDYIWDDFLACDLQTLVGDESYYVVANLPYYITSAIIRKLLDHDNRPRRLVVTVQKEVAERIIAQPGDMSILSVAVQFYGEASLVMRLNRGIFWPRPDVDSAVLRIDCYESLPYQITDTRFFFEIVRAGFGQKRKQLKNALNQGLVFQAEAINSALSDANIDPKRRAETLSIEEWSRLYHVLKAMR